MTLRLSVPLAAAAFCVAALSSGTAHAGKQHTVKSQVPPLLAPKATKTPHEIGVSLNVRDGNFSPRFNWRMVFNKTSAFGKLGGLTIGANVGPEFGGNNVRGVAGFDIGYEIDPWSNLSLTFTPIAFFDNVFADNVYVFSNTFGAEVRLYLGGNWIVYYAPFAFGYAVSKSGWSDFSWKMRWGFAYKF